MAAAQKIVAFFLVVSERVPKLSVTLWTTSGPVVPLILKQLRRALESLMTLPFFDAESHSRNGRLKLVTKGAGLKLSEVVAETLANLGLVHFLCSL